MIKVKSLSKVFKHKKQQIAVLSSINLEIKQGEIFGIIGKSGAGKSTLLKCLNLLERPDQGSVIIDGVDLTKITAAELRQTRQKIGVIFQGFNLLNSKTVFANIALPLVLQKQHSKSEIKDKVDRLLDLVGLTEFAHKYPLSLSGGQKQRVGIARALATDPKILLSDEATSALDPQTTNSILDLLLDINEKLGVTIVLITHQIEVVRKICDKVAVIEGGQIIESGNTVDVMLHPHAELTRKLILEEETSKYLKQVADFYTFEKSSTNKLLLLSFIGNTTFEPILSQISAASGVKFSILRGEVGRIKKMPFGQLLLEASGEELQLINALAYLGQLKMHYEIIH
ncbi:MAG: methionine ABC transporter ATP-binding protein [Burkholderiales bacterium]